MSTHSAIGVKHADGKITGCYVHYDGGTLLPRITDYLHKNTTTGLVMLIDRAQATGGIRSFHCPRWNDKIPSEPTPPSTEFLDDNEPYGPSSEEWVYSLGEIVPMQGGFDSVNPAAPKHTAANIVSTNTQGFDCSTSSTGGTTAYKKAINAISNPDEFDINMLVTPGIVHGLHSVVTNHAISKMEARGDAFYVLDCVKQGDTIATATAAINTLDTNYAATYYPWVKIIDRNTSLPVWVPPSVVLAGTIAYTDKVAHEWFAPAGLNRGGLTSVTEAQTRLTHSERDELYEDRVNPIATFPGQGVVVWGQKTLQGKPSALDRVNVRRLLIRVKKFIASASRYLVFEQNNTALRQRFLNIANPFLESVQQNAGLSAFRVVMDESNNTPDVIDRNQLVGQIFLQPTRTAEFIVLDFTILPTGATFPE